MNEAQNLQKLTSRPDVAVKKYSETVLLTFVWTLVINTLFITFDDFCTKTSDKCPSKKSEDDENRATSVLQKETMKRI